MSEQPAATLPGKAGSRGGWIRLAVAVVGIGLAVFFMWLSFRKVGFREVQTYIAAASPAWLVVAALIYGSSIVVRGLRWRLLLLRATEISRSTVIGGLFVGFAMNLALPGRLGELYRADYIGTVARISRSMALGTIFVERVLDGLLLVGLLALSSVAAGLGGEGGGTLVRVMISALVLFGGAFLGFVILRRIKSLPIPLIGGLLMRFQAGLQAIDRRNALAFFGYSLAVWILELAALAVLLYAVRQQPTLIGVCLILSAASLSTLLPTAPAFVGSFQFAFILCFGALGWPAPVALAASILVQLCFYVPTMLIGSAIMARGYWRRVRA